MFMKQSGKESRCKTNTYTFFDVSCVHDGRMRPGFVRCRRGAERMAPAIGTCRGGDNFPGILFIKKDIGGVFYSQLKKAAVG